MVSRVAQPGATLTLRRPLPARCQVGCRPVADFEDAELGARKPTSDASGPRLRFPTKNGSWTPWSTLPRP